jgi:chromosome segregation ATPase
MNTTTNSLDALLSLGDVLNISAMKAELDGLKSEAQRAVDNNSALSAQIASLQDQLATAQTNTEQARISELSLQLEEMTNRATSAESTLSTNLPLAQNALLEMTTDRDTWKNKVTELDSKLAQLIANP